MKRTLLFSVALSFSIVAPVSALNMPSLMAQWGFDEATGVTLLDSTSKGNDGTLIGDAERIEDHAPTGIANLKSLSLNGASYATMPHLDIDNHSFTITAWLKNEAQPTNQVWFSQGDTTQNGKYVALRLTPEKALEFSFGDDDLVTHPNALSSDTWHQVAYTFNAKTKHREIYVDGMPVASGTSSGVYIGATGLATLGRFTTQPFGSEYWHGSIDDVRVYDQAFLTNDILALSVSVPTVSSKSSSSSARSLTSSASSTTPRFYQTMSRTDRLILKRSLQQKTVVRVFRRPSSASSTSSLSVSSVSSMSSSMSSASSAKTSSQTISTRSSQSSLAPSSANLYQVTSFQLHLRKDSRATAVNIQTLMPYTRLTVLQMLKNGWAQVQTMDGVSGYVNASFIEKVQ